MVNRNGSNDYVTRVHDDLADIDPAQWDALVAASPLANPFMTHACLLALHRSGSATPDTGWQAQYLSLWRGDELWAACPLYVKSHSYGEYVFDWAWADAYARHGLDYYPKAVVAVPFTPVPGARLLAADATARAALVQALLQWAAEAGMSSLHLLFAADEDLAAARQAGLMLRHTVQFHWQNRHPAEHRPFTDFDDFLSALSQDKRKKIRQERQRVARAGVTFKVLRGTEIAPADWDFFYLCYERTYLEHGNPPYLTRDFFARMAAHMPEAWVLFVAQRSGQPIATSLIAASSYPSSATGQNDHELLVAYGRYWGALERVDCLHFEACYYQPLAWCIAQGVARFEGGAQGTHKMARALLPVQASSAHWLAHPQFAQAVDDFLAREGRQMNLYLQELEAHSPFKQGG
jgi:predicted N-acyltransferase